MGELLSTIRNSGNINRSALDDIYDIVYLDHVPRSDTWSFKCLRQTCCEAGTESHGFQYETAGV